MDMVLKRTAIAVAAIWQSLRQLRHARERPQVGAIVVMGGAAAVTSAWSAALIRTATDRRPGNHYHWSESVYPAGRISAYVLPGG
jgi:hypothetical protein